MRGWVALLALGLAAGLQVVLIEHLASADSAQVLLASWEPALALQFVGTLGLRVLLFLGLPPALVLLVAHRAGSTRTEA